MPIPKGKVLGAGGVTPPTAHWCPTDACTIFLDECGQHTIAAPDAFPVFVLAATIVRDVDFPVVDAEWKRWKHENFGSDANSP